MSSLAVVTKNAVEIMLTLDPSVFNQKAVASETVILFAISILANCQTAIALKPCKIGNNTNGS